MIAAGVPPQLLQYAVIYRNCPAGMPMPLAFRKLKTVCDDDKAKLNALLQQIAWDTVESHPMSGVGE